MSRVLTYVVQLHETLDNLPVEQIEQVIQLLEQARLRRQQVFILGNGGSASTASHFVCDLAKNARRPDCPHFRVIGLTDNMAVFSAYANDDGYESVFAEQLANLARPGDVVIGISASGNSANVLRAIDLANALGATTVGLTGFDGGELGSKVAIHINVPSRTIEHVEDIHLSLEHMICKALREEVHPSGSIPVEPGALFSRETPQPATERDLPLQAPGSGAGQARDRLELLAALGRELTPGNDPGVILQRILGLTVSGLGATSGSLLILDEDRSVVEAALAYAGSVRRAHGLEDTVRRGLAGWVIDNRQPALVSSTLDDPRWLPTAWEKDEQVRRSAACVPLMVRGRVAGVMTIVQGQGSQLTQDDVAMLAAVAVCVSMAGADILGFVRPMAEATSPRPNGELP